MTNGDNCCQLIIMVAVLKIRV